MRLALLTAMTAVAAASGLPFVSPPSAWPLCPVNASYFPPLTCPTGYECCAMPATPVCHDVSPPCTTCPFCCHSYLNATECAACNSKMCAGHTTIGDQGCNTTHPDTWTPWNPSCCGRGMPEAPSTTLPNCLLVGTVSPLANSASSSTCCATTARCRCLKA